MGQTERGEEDIQALNVCGFLRERECERERKRERGERERESAGVPFRKCKCL